MRWVVGAVQYRGFEGGFLEFARLAVEAGFRWVELRFEPHTITPSFQEMADLRRLGETHRVPFSVHAPYMEVNIGSLDDDLYEASRWAYHRAVRFAAAIGATYVTVHAGKLSQAERTPASWEAAKARSLRALLQVQAAAAEQGVTLCLENLGAFRPEVIKYGTSATELLEIRRALGPSLRFTLDLGHLKALPADPLEFIQALMPETVALTHLHTNVGTEDDHLPIRADDAQLEAFLRAYDREGWSFPLNIEVRTEAHLRKSREVLLWLLEKLR
jgi:sugar phosphate isomerase/epimerase